MKFSIIVPVYNVETYLEECIDSVLEQSYQDFELILVDDGSTDSSPTICDRYERQDTRIKVIHKANGGLSSARNAGIEKATGDIICFVDSDDYWNNAEGLSVIADMFTQYNVDVVEFSCWKFWDNTSILKEEVLPKVFHTRGCNADNKEDNLHYMICNGEMTSCAWNKACRKSLFENGNLRFREGVIAEDIDWAARLMESGQTFISIPTLITAYRKRKGSITSSTNIDKTLQLISNLTYIHNNFGTRRYIQPYLSIAVGNLLINLSSLSSEDYSQIIPSCSSILPYLKYKPTLRTKILFYLNLLFGTRLTCQAIRLLLKR